MEIKVSYPILKVDDAIHRNNYYPVYGVVCIRWIALFSL